LRCHLCIKCIIILPRQARDKHNTNSKHIVLSFLVFSCLFFAQEGGAVAAMAVPTVEEVLSSNGLGEGGDPSELEQKLAERVVELSAEVAELRKLNKARLVKDEKRRAAAARKEEAERKKKQELDAKEKVEKDKAAAKVRCASHSSVKIDPK
jgi:hypothetical protein